MPKKQKKDAKKPKGKQLPPVQSYKTITREEIQLQEQKYNTRISELKFRMQYINEAVEGVIRINKEQIKQHTWDLYVNCDPLPKIENPPEIHAFFTQQDYLEKDDIKSTNDWTLMIDERSVLTQDILREDLTRKTLENTIKRDLGYQYEQLIGNSIKILNRIDYYLANICDFDKINDETLKDITTLRLIIQQHIKQYINNYTYRIICSDDAYMNSLDAITEDYCYSCDYFDMHLWSVKRVPIRLTHIHELRFLLNLHNINLTVHIPYSVLRNDLTIKAVRLNYDHLSEYAKTFTQIIPEGYDKLSAGIQNLAECLMTEWIMQTELQESIRTQMIEAYENYAIKLMERQEAAARDKKGADTGKIQNRTGRQQKNRKLKTALSAPPLLGANEYPDIYDKFLETEESQYKIFMENVHSPKRFNLHYHQINLRKYLIVGGIYQLFYVKKPGRTNFNKFNMTWHLNDLSIEENVVITEEAVQSATRSTGTRISEISTKRISSLASERKLSITTNITPKIEKDCPWFTLIFELPEELCLWGVPIPCHFEHFEDEIEIPEKKHTSFESQLNFSNKVPKFYPELEKEDKAKKESIVHKHQMELANVNEVALSTQRNSNPARSSANYYSQSLFTSRITINGRIPSNMSVPENIDDFNLTDLSLPRVYILQRYCADKLLTSYKFAKDISEELAKLELKRSRGKAGVLQLQKVDEKKPINNDIFSYDENQNKPEYLYPYYVEKESINMERPLEDIPNTLPYKPTTFYQLVSTVLLIKKLIHDNLSHMLEMEPFNSEPLIQGKNIKIKTNKTPEKTEVRESRVQFLRGSHGQPSHSSTSQHHHHHHPSRSHSTDLNEEKKLSRNALHKATLCETQKVSYYHWTTRHIKTINFDKEGRKLTIETDRLGYIGFALDRYEHFPFKYWDLKPNENDPSNAVTFTIETQHVKCVLNITELGISGYVTDPIKGYVSNPKMYLVIDEPLRDYDEFKKRFKERNINIFAEHDACFYITNGYFSEKHLASELHTYCCMALHCTHINFHLSGWNRLAKRREILLEYIQLNDVVNTPVTVLIKPEEAKFVQVVELCSDNESIIKLHYKPTWRNVDSYCDLHHLICSMYTTANDLRCKNPKLLCYLRDLLSEIRPLSFS